jgi:hypothetical protein
MDTNELPTLCFPVPGPLKEVVLDDNSSVVMYLTLPMAIFAPAMSRLSEGKNSTLYSTHMRLFTMMIYLFNQKLFLSKQLAQRAEDANPADAATAAKPNPKGTYKDTNALRSESSPHVDKFAIYFEYLLSDQVELGNTPPELFCTGLINCIGIRFYFVISDNDAEFLKGLELAFQPTVPKKGKKPEPPKKETKNSAGGLPSQQYDFYKALTGPFEWYRACATYLGMAEDGSVDVSLCTRGPLLSPLVEHPLHPTEVVFSHYSSCLAGTHALQLEESALFAFPKMAFRVPPVMVSPIAMLCVTLPLSTQWSKQREDLGRETLRTFTDLPRMEKYFTSGYTRKNDLRDIRRLMEVRLTEIRKAVDLDEEEKIASRRRLSAECVRSLQDVWCDNANVSQPIKLMYRWCLDYDTWTADTELCVWDNELSYFGNLIATEMWSLEADFGFSTTHAVFLRTMVCAMNAYRYKMALHCNVLMLGQGATGKSHILETIEEICIPDTTTKVSHETDKAAAVDSDNNDHISLFHEAPPNFLGSGDKHSDQQTGSHILKDKMTSGLTKTLTIFCDSDTGRRYQVSCSSESVGVYLIATNERADSIPEALATRMANFNVDTVERPGFNVIDKADAHVPDEVLANKDKHILRWRMRQVMINMVEKAIFIKCLRDVDLTIPRLMFGNMCSKLVERGLAGNSSTVRGKAFVLNFIRTLTILHAVDRYANHPDAPGFRKEINFKNLMDIQPYLVCTEEIALFGITFCSDQIMEQNSLRAMEAVTGAFYGNFNSTNGRPEPANAGEYILTGMPENRAYMYQSISAHINNNKSYDVRMSPENLKVSFRQLCSNTFEGVPVISDKLSDGYLHINKRYLDSNFRFDPSLNRFTCVHDVPELFLSVFKESYAYKHMPPCRTFVLGCAVDPQLPFALETRVVEPNPSRVMQVHRMSLNFRNDENVDDIADEYMPRFMEEKVLDDFMGPGHGLSAQALFHDHNIECPTRLPGTYPENLAQYFVKVHGIRLKGNKRVRVEKEYEKYRLSKQKKLDAAQAKNN